MNLKNIFYNLMSEYNITNKRFKHRVDILIHVAEAHAKRERHRRKKLQKST